MSRFMTACSLALAIVVTPLLIADTVQATTTAPGRNGNIAYTTNTHHQSSVWIAKPNGTKRTLVSSSHAQNPTWSPDGRTLVFTAGKSNNCNSQLIALTLDSMQQRTIAKGGCITDPVWSPDGTKLAFSRTQTGERGDKNALFSVHASTGMQIPITGWSTSDRFRAPSWSPDGKRIVYEKYSAAVSNLFITDSSGKTVLLTTLSDVTRSSQASWSPDGKKIVYADSNNEVYTIWPDGSHRSVISDGDSYDASWSPDGSHLVFLEDRSGEALAMRQTDGTVTQIPMDLQGYATVAQPSWSPDSSTILFMATTEQGRTDMLSLNIQRSQGKPQTLVRAVSGGISWQARP